MGLIVSALRIQGGWYCLMLVGMSSIRWFGLGLLCELDCLGRRNLLDVRLKAEARF
jgi:hypothetical protein